MPTYAASGEILDGGAELTLPGATGYYFDVIYICVLVQVATILTDWAWLLFLLVPSYGLYQLYRHVIGPWLASKSATEVRTAGLIASRSTCFAQFIAKCLLTCIFIRLPAQIL